MGQAILLAEYDSEGTKWENWGSGRRNKYEKGELT